MLCFNLILFIFVPIVILDEQSERSSEILKGEASLQRYVWLVFLTLLMLFCYCAHLVSGSTSIVLQLVQTGFNVAEISCRIARNLGVLLMNSNCFAIISSAF